MPSMPPRIAQLLRVGAAQGLGAQRPDAGMGERRLDDRRVRAVPGRRQELGGRAPAGSGRGGAGNLGCSHLRALVEQLIQRAPCGEGLAQTRGALQADDDSSICRDGGGLRVRIHPVGLLSAHGIVRRGAGRAANSSRKARGRHVAVCPTTRGGRPCGRPPTIFSVHASSRARALPQSTLGSLAIDAAIASSGWS